MKIHGQIAAAAVGAFAVLVAGAAPATAAPRFGPRVSALLARSTPKARPAGPITSAAPVLSPSGTTRFRTIDVPGAFGTLVDGFSDSGSVGGTYFTDNGAKSHGFIVHGSKLVRLDYPGTSGVTSLDGMSGDGVAVGTYVDAAGTYHGWVRSADGEFRKLDDPLAAPGPGYGTFPEGLNEDGVIVGYYVDKNNLAHGFVYSPKSGFKTVDVPAAGTAPGLGTVMVSINDSGVIVGTYLDAAGVYHGFATARGSFFYFDAPGTGTKANQGTIAYGITGDGLISGWTLHTDNEISGWLLSDWQFSPLNDPLAATGPDLGSALYGIDEQGAEAGGEYWDASGRFHGFVARLSN